MSKYKLRYLELKERGFNKALTLDRFVYSSRVKIIEIFEKKKGRYYNVRQKSSDFHKER